MVNEMDNDAIEVFHRVHSLKWTPRDKPLNAADLAFVADMLQRRPYIKDQRDSSNNGLLHRAVAGIRADLVSFLAQNGVDVNGRKGVRGASVLYEAVLSGQVDIVRALLDLHADVHLPGGRKKDTPLCAAAMAGKRDIVEVLLAKGADPKDCCPAKSGHPLLNRLAPCVYSNHVSLLLVARLQLLGHGALMTPDRTGRTALHCAAHGGNHFLVKALLDAGAIVDDSNKESLMTLAFIGRRKDAFDSSWDSSRPEDDIKVALLLIEQGATLDFLDEDGCSLLHHAAKRDSKLMCDFLVQRGADVNVKAKDGKTPLHMTFDLETATYLLDKDADVNGGVKSAADGTATPLLYVLRRADDLLIRFNESRRNLRFLYQKIIAMSNLLLDRGSTIEGTTKESEALSALHCAACTGDVSLVTRLLDMGADVNAKVDENGYSALHYAVKHHRNAVVSLLVARGADINAACSAGTTPLMELICHSTYVDTRKSEWLMDLSDSDDENYDFHVYDQKTYDESSRQTATALLDAGADVNARVAAGNLSDRGNSALHFAVRHPKKIIVSLLIDRGADINAANQDGMTPLLQLCTRPSSVSKVDASTLAPTLAIATSLLDAGANVNATMTDSGVSVVLLAASEWCNLDLMALLLARGGDASAKDAAGRTALHHACLGTPATEEILQLLIKHGADLVAVDDQGRRASALASGFIQAFLLEEERILLEKEEEQLILVEEAEMRMHSPAPKRARLEEDASASSSSSSSSSS